MQFDLIAYLVDRCRQRFHEDGNPLHVWAAYRLSRQRHALIPSVGGTLSTLKVAPATSPRSPLPLPEWIADYLDVCADNLLSGEDPKHALLLTIAGGAPMFTQIVNRERDEHIAAFVDLLLSVERDEALKIVRDIDAEAVDRFIRPPEGGGSFPDLICQFVAEQTEREDNPFSTKPLSFEMVRSTYYRLKDSI